MARKVLVVDDNADERQIYSALLYYNGFDVVEASSGADALQVARRERPDVVITDYMMPQMSGLALCRALHGQPETRNTPIVCITAYELSLEQAMAAGCVQLWHKPVPPAKLVLGLEKLLPDTGISPL